MTRRENTEIDIIIESRETTASKDCSREERREKNDAGLFPLDLTTSNFTNKRMRENNSSLERKNRIRLIQDGSL